MPLGNKEGPKPTTIGVFLVCPGGLGGTPGGSGAPGWQIPGVRGFLGLADLANFPKAHFSAILGVWGGTPRGGLGPQAGRIQGPGASCAGPRGDPANFLENRHIFGH